MSESEEAHVMRLRRKDLLHYMVASYVQHCYRKGIFCDLVLEAAGGEAIHCHKMVMFSVFPKFKHFMSDDSADVILLPDFPGEALRDLVNSIYWSLHEKECLIRLEADLEALAEFHEKIDQHALSAQQDLAELVKVKIEEELAAAAAAKARAPPVVTQPTHPPHPFDGINTMDSDFTDTIDACEDFFNDSLNDDDDDDTGDGFDDDLPPSPDTLLAATKQSGKDDEDFVKSFKKIRRMKFPERYGASGKRLLKALDYEQEDEIVKQYPAVAKTLMESELDLANSSMEAQDKKKAMYDILQSAKRNWRTFIRNYKCDCDVEPANTFFQAEKHVTISHSNRFSLCEMCDTIRLKEKIDKHRRLCRAFYQKDGNTCAECGRQYKSRMELTNHISDAHKKVKCKICGEEVVGHGALQRHRQKLHPVLVQCDQCPMTFPSNFKLRTHQIRMHLPDSQKPFICDQCGKGFLYKRKLDEHMMYSHIRSFPMQCRFGCEKRFNDSNMRRSHEVRVHNAPSKKRG